MSDRIMAVVEELKSASRAEHEAFLSLQLAIATQNDADLLYKLAKETKENAQRKLSGVIFEETSL